MIEVGETFITALEGIVQDIARDVKASKITGHF